MYNKNAGAGLGSIRNISWRYYNLIRKKAMEKEPGFTGLLVSLSIAFFIVAGGAEGLNIVYRIYGDQDRPAKTSEEKTAGEKILINRCEDVFQYVARIRVFRGTINALAAGSGCGSKIKNYL